MISGQFLPRAVAAGLALAAGLATAPSTASAATTAQHYQAKVNMVCGGNCVVQFALLTSKQVLDIHHVACQVFTSGVGVLSLATLTIAPGSGLFSYPLELQWQRPLFDGTAYTVGAEVDLRVPGGKRATVEMLVGGNSPTGYCSITGTLYTQS